MNVINNYIQKVAHHGIKRSIKIGAHKITHFFNQSRWRYYAYHKKANHTWTDIQRNHAYEQSFDILFESHRLKVISFLNDLYKNTIDAKNILEDADFFVRGGVNLLGSGKLYFERMPWHEDFKLKKINPHADYVFDATQFYADITIPLSQTTADDALQKDIKVPWELSRCYHFLVLGYAYQQTGQNHYKDTFVAQITDWIESNPYLRGVNWVCPMEVAIRAINWIVAIEYFKCDIQSDDFWQKIICSLYDHLIYLEHNWELYDGRTSNHYLANLVGYFYLCWFFSDLPGFDKKRDWCYQELMREYKKQVFNDGADYEGSTKYHRLKTEMWYHAYLLCKEQNLEITHDFKQRLHGMMQFIDWCTPHGGSLITIGDDDSGKILYYGLPKNNQLSSYGSIHPPSLKTSADTADLVKTSSARQGEHLCSKSYLIKSSMMEINQSNVDFVGTVRGEFRILCGVSNHTNDTQYFPQFGLSIIKTETLHVSLRHHAYENRQPSGHFHNDVGSITLAVDGVPIIVDPGSYVYTASAYWRNYFRSVQMHNTFFLHNEEPVAFDARLFFLAVPESKQYYEPIFENDSITLKVEHDLYAHYGLRAQRTVTFNMQHIIISDQWVGNVADIISCWNFTLAPGIEPVYDNDYINLNYRSKLLARMYSPQLKLIFEKEWVAIAYGEKEQTVCLRAMVASQEIVTIIEFF